MEQLHELIYLHTEKFGAGTHPWAGFPQPFANETSVPEGFHNVVSEQDFCHIISWRELYSTAVDDGVRTLGVERTVVKTCTKLCTKLGILAAVRIRLNERELNPHRAACTTVVLLRSCCNRKVISVVEAGCLSHRLRHSSLWLVRRAHNKKEALTRLTGNLVYLANDFITRFMIHKHWGYLYKHFYPCQIYYRRLISCRLHSIFDWFDLCRPKVIHTFK